MSEPKKELLIPVFVESEQLLELPKINIKKIIDALRSENQDELIALYHLFLQRDLHLSSEILKRRMQVLSVPFFVESEDESVREFLKWYLHEIEVESLIFDLTNAIPYGFSCIDMVYEPIEIQGKSYFAPKKFECIHPRFFRWDVKKRLFEIQKDSNTKINPQEVPEKFFFHIHKSESGSMGDFALMNRVLFTCAMKHAVLSANMQYFESLGIPPVIVQYDSDDEDMLKKILQQMQNLRSNSMGIFPKEALVNLLEGRAGKTEFLSFVQYCDTVISRYVLGNTLSGGEDKGGSYALGKVHDGRRKDFLTFDCRMLEKSLQGFLKRVLGLNLSKNVPFAFKFDTSDETDEKLLSETYKNLSDAGYSIPVEHIEKVFAIQGVEKKETLGGRSEGEEKEPNQKKERNGQAKKLPLTRLDGGIEEALEKSPLDIKKTLDFVLAKAESFEEAYDAILEYEGEDFFALEEGLSEAIANASIFGSGSE